MAGSQRTQKQAQNHVFSGPKVFKVAGAGHPMLVDHPLGLVDALNACLSTNEKDRSPHTQTVGLRSLMLEEGVHDKLHTGQEVEALWGRWQNGEYHSCTILSLDFEAATCKVKWKRGDDDHSNKTSTVSVSSNFPIWCIRIPQQNADSEQNK